MNHQSFDALNANSRNGISRVASYIKPVKLCIAVYKAIINKIWFTGTKKNVLIQLYSVIVLMYFIGPNSSQRKRHTFFFSTKSRRRRIVQIIHWKVSQCTLKTTSMMMNNWAQFSLLWNTACKKPWFNSTQPAFIKKCVV